METSLRKRIVVSVLFTFFLGMFTATVFAEETVKEPVRVEKRLSRVPETWKLKPNTVPKVERRLDHREAGWWKNGVPPGEYRGLRDYGRGVGRGPGKGALHRAVRANKETSTKNPNSEGQ